MGKLRALVIDDDGIVLRSCERVLGAEGFEVQSAPNVGEALAKMSKETYGLLLVDVKMPGRDGMWFMRRVKETSPEIPVIIMSGYPTRETVAEAIQLGARRFIAKPFTPDELVECVRDVLQTRCEYEDAQDSGH